MSPRKLLFINTVTAVLVAVFIIPLFMYAGQALESKYFPVIDNYVLTSIVQTSENNTLISGHFTRLRACEYQWSEWTVKDKDTGFERPLPLHRPAEQPDRNMGINEFKNVVVFTTPEQFRMGVKGIAYYKCHPLWLTATQFYP